MMGGEAFWEPNIGIPLDAGTVDFAGVHVRVIENVPIIFPNVPLPFTYDPISKPREKLNERIEAICREIRESILAQAEAYERQAKEAGFQPRPPRLPHEQIRRIARAIYRRAICRWKWDDIRQEYMTDDDPVWDAQRFADRIRSWAKACNIPLK